MKYSKMKICGKSMTNTETRDLQMIQKVARMKAGIMIVMILVFMMMILKAWHWIEEKWMLLFIVENCGLWTFTPQDVHTAMN